MSIVIYSGPTTPQEIRKYLLRRTKDQIVFEYLRLWREFGDIEKERDALAAHVRRLHSALEAAVESPELGGGEWYAGAVSVMSDAPATSLARHKAEWQAEALERYSRIITEEWIDKGESYGLRTASGQALIQATELRRQAEEPTP
ncbi:MAG: hypothetical protein ACQEXC_14290 [Pseudomonadota bacterium]